MYREVLLKLSNEDLKENIGRLELAIDELQYCLDSLIEEQDELVSTNSMYNDTVSNLVPKNLTKSKKFTNSILKGVKNFWNTPHSQWKNEIKIIIDQPNSFESSNRVESPLKNLESGNRLITDKNQETVVFQMISEEIPMPKISKYSYHEKGLLAKIKSGKNKPKKLSSESENGKK